jgi:acetate---CoA ligase (ADP-forming)
MTPQAVTLDVIRDLASHGVKNAILLTAGYGEAGASGTAAQRELVRLADELDFAFIGPNNLGIANWVDGMPVCSIQVQPNTNPAVALLSQSGASSAAMHDFAQMTGVELSYMVTLGNEAMITAGHLLDFLAEDESTKAIAIFLEAVRDPDVFRRAALKAAERRKPIIVLKVGSSELAARTARAHTGALVGDDRVVDAVFRELGIIRVDTIEDMLLAAGIAAHLGPIEQPGIAIASISGGACDVIADRAQDLGASLPALAQETTDRIGEFFAAFGTVQNPLDVTGAAVIDPTIFAKAVTALADDPSIGVVGVVNALPLDGAPEQYPGRPILQHIGAGMKAASVPTLYINQVIQPTSAAGRWLLDDAQIPYAASGLKSAVHGMHKTIEWSQRCRELGATVAPRPTPRVPAPTARTGTWSEAAARDLLEAAGIPVVPAKLVTSAEEAVLFAKELDGPVAIKVVSPQILHKSDIGGVKLGVEGPDAVRQAYDEVVHAGRGVAGAEVQGALVSPMRTGATELLVGVVRDPQWGLILAAAVGGVFVEALDDSVLTPLPVTPERATVLLGRLKAAMVLDGFRGSAPADRAALGEFVAQVGDLALALGDELVSLEINPVRVDGSQIEALDAVVEWKAE